MAEIIPGDTRYPIHRKKSPTTKRKNAGGSCTRSPVDRFTVSPSAKRMQFSGRRNAPGSVGKRAVTVSREETFAGVMHPRTVEKIVSIKRESISVHAIHEPAIAICEIALNIPAKATEGLGFVSVNYATIFRIVTSRTRNPRRYRRRSS